MNAYPFVGGDPIEDRYQYDYADVADPEYLHSWRQARDEAWSSDVPMATAAKTDGPPLDLLIRRFEITKRIHGAYGEDGRPIDPADCRDLDRYLTFAERAEYSYDEDKALTTLNALLKCLDTLCTLRHRLGTTGRARLNRLIERERVHVEELIR